MAAWLPPATPLAAGAWPWYQAPEQLYQGGQPGYWSDIYAMACVVHRALTGQPPFAGSSVEEVRQGHLQTPPPSVSALRPDLAPELNGALQLGLAKAPADLQVVEIAGAVAVQRYKVLVESIFGVLAKRFLAISGLEILFLLILFLGHVAQFLKNSSVNLICSEALSTRTTS